MKESIGIDMDGVIADLHSEWLRRYNYDYNDNLKKEDIIEWNWHKLTHPDCQEKIYTYLDDPELFENLPVIEYSQVVIEKLSKEFEVFIITAPFNPNNVVPKYKWLKTHFSFLNSDNFVFTKNKHVCAVDYLVDDNAKNFGGVNVCGILFEAAHNKNETRWVRVKNWLEIDEYLHSMF